MTVYQAIYEIISPKVEPYDTFYPFASSNIDMKKGFCSFAEIIRKNINDSDKRVLPDGAYQTTSSVEIDMSISLQRYIDTSSWEESAPEKASLLQTYLMSEEALGLFFERGFELGSVIGDIKTEGVLTDDKVWTLKSGFTVKLYLSNVLVLSYTNNLDKSLFYCELGLPN